MRRAALLVVGCVLAVTGCSSDARTAAPSAPAPTSTPTATPSPQHTHPPRPTHRPSPHPTPTRTHAATQAAVPKVVHATYVFPVRCSVSYGHSHHDYPATDIFAARGCPVVAATSGRVDEVSSHDTWSSSSNDGATRGGLSLSIVGDDGVRYYGSHLESIASGIAPGVRVHAGQLIGHVGNTGDARGGPTHLHFGLSWPTRSGAWWVRRGMVYPWPYLDSWRAGGQRSPAAAVAAVHKQDGDVPPCHVDC